MPGPLTTFVAGAIPVLTALCGELTTGSVSPSRTPSRAETMPFAECVALVEDVSEELGVDPVSVMRTGDVWMARLDAVDGSLMITCSRPDNRLTLRRHQAPLQAPLTALPASRG